MFSEEAGSLLILLYCCSIRDDGGVKSKSKRLPLLTNPTRPPAFVFLLYHARSGKGGKNRRRGKNENEESKRELEFKEAGQEYAQVRLWNSPRQYVFLCGTSSAMAKLAGLLFNRSFWKLCERGRSAVRAV